MMTNCTLLDMDNEVRMSKFKDNTAARVKPQQITIPLGNGRKLIATRNTNPDYKNEIIVSVLDSDDVWLQDLAIIRPSYSIDENLEINWSNDKFDVLVYAANDTEDYPYEFVIPSYTPSLALSPSCKT